MGALTVMTIIEITSHLEITMSFTTTETTKTMGRTNGSTRRDDRPVAQLWLNVGVNYIDEHTGEETFINLPMGIPIDTMDETPLRGTSDNYHQIVQVKNMLLRELQAAGNGMAPGDEQLVSGLELQLRKVVSVAEKPASGNPMAASIGKLSFGSGAVTKVG